MKHLPRSTAARLTALLVTLAASLPAQAQHSAHVHGLVRLDVVVEPGRLSLQFEAPQEALLGHERAPRTAAEKQAASALLARLRSGPPLWVLDAALGCTLRSSEIQAPMLDPAAASGAATEHAEVAASVEYHCTGAPRQIDLGPLLDAYKGVARVEARIVGPDGQRKASLKRPQRLLAWGR